MIFEIYGHGLKELETESVALFIKSLGFNGAKFGASRS